MKNKKTEEIKDLMKRGFTLAVATALVVSLLTACNPEQPETPDNDKDNEIVDTENPNENQNPSDDDKYTDVMPELTPEEQEFNKELVEFNPEYENGIGSIAINRISSENKYAIIIVNRDGFIPDDHLIKYASEQEIQSLLENAKKYFMVEQTKNGFIIQTKIMINGANPFEFYAYFLDKFNPFQENNLEQ